MKFTWIITILITCNVLACLAQQINIRNYGIEDGLVNNDVLNIYQDRQGFIWLCTRGGLSRYDGTRFTNYTTDNGLTNDMINDIVEVAPQKFIVAQNSGGPRLLENGRISPLPTPSSITLNRFYWDSNRRLLATTDHQGVIEWKKNNLQPVNSVYKQSIGELAILDDSLWVTIRYDRSVQLMTNRLNPYSLSARLNATTTYTDSRHRTWLGTTKGLMLLAAAQKHHKTIVFTPLPPAFDIPTLRESWISDFLEDSQGNCWIATTGGLVRIQQNGQASVFTEKEGLPASLINCVWEDRQKNIWIGTSSGLAKYSPNIKIFTQKHGHSVWGSVFILPVTENNMRLFDGMASNSDLNLLTDSFSHVSPKDIPGYDSYKISPEELLLTNTKEHRLLKSGKNEADRINWPPFRFSSVVRIDSENFAGSAGKKLFIITKGKAQEQITLNIAGDIYNMVLDKTGILWVGTWESGLYKIKWRRDREHISLEVADSLTNELPDQHIRALFWDKENELWIGTRYKGAIRLLEPVKGKYEMQHYGTPQGLSSNFVTCVNRDKKGNIWAGTMQGLDKLIHSNGQYRIFNFGKINNIYSVVREICFLKNDYLVAGGSPAVIYARDIQQDTLPPPVVYITKVDAGTKVSEGATVDGQITRLSYHQPQIYFEFCAPQFINEKWNEYRYRLIGSHDTTWTKAPGSKSVHFASLKPGNYVFEVKVLGFNGEWGQPAKHYFIVTTPFWEKAWFISLIIAAIALLLYALYRYRVHQLFRLQKVRNRIATDLHDEIGSNLTNISILSSLSKRNLSQPKQANEFLQRISEEVRSSSQALDDIIWSVNANHDTLEDTVSRMRRYAAELFDGANIAYDLYLDPAFEEKKLIMEQRRDIYLLYKEAVNNIFKHARAKQVIIKVAIEHNILVLDIADDGKGFNTNKESDRHGLEGMKSRVNKSKGKIQIESGENKGTLIHCEFPLIR